MLQERMHINSLIATKNFISYSEQNNTILAQLCNYNYIIYIKYR